MWIWPVIDKLIEPTYTSDFRNPKGAGCDGAGRVLGVKYTHHTYNGGCKGGRAREHGIVAFPGTLGK